MFIEHSFIEVSQRALWPDGNRQQYFVHTTHMFTFPTDRLGASRELNDYSIIDHDHLLSASDHEDIESFFVCLLPKLAHALVHGCKIIGTSCCSQSR